MNQLFSTSLKSSTYRLRPSQLQAATRRDPILSKVLRCVKSGWPKHCETELRPYWFRRFELTVEGGCLLWGIRVLVPRTLQGRLLDELHQDHPGITRMKSVARSYMWWPGLDKAIENLAKSCSSCLAVKHAPAVAPLQPWVWPDQPWKRVHLDFAGPFQGSMFLVAVDAHSKWPEVHLMKETTAAKTLDVLRVMFSAHGLPEQLVTDNGPQFVAEEFATFAKLNGIKHIRCAPYHPASNGLAERFVQSLKMALKASVNSGYSLQRRVLNFLLNYRSTPHATTSVSPSSLFLHRQIRTRLDLLRPNCESHVRDKQSQQKSQHDQRAHDRQFFVGQTVMARNLRPGADWVPAVVVERLGPLSYLVETSDKLLWKRHIDLLRELEVRNRDSEFQEPDAPDLDVPNGDSLAPPLPVADLPTVVPPARPDSPVAEAAVIPAAPGEAVATGLDSPDPPASTSPPAIVQRQYPTRANFFFGPTFDLEEFAELTNPPLNPVFLVCNYWS